MFNNAKVMTSSVNRYDMAQVIYNIYLSQKDYQLKDMPAVNTAGIANHIADYQKVPSNYRTAVEFCYAAGFITGTDSAGTFAGEAAMTRAQAAVVLCRLLDAKNMHN